MAVGLKAGERAPIAGDLFSPELGIVLHQRADHCDERTRAAVTATAAAFREDLRFERRVAAADRRIVEVERDGYKREIEGSPNLWLVAGLSVGITAIIVTALYVATGAGERLRDEAAGR